MAKENLIPTREASSVPETGSTKKDQKGYQLPEQYDARTVNAEFDRIHKRVNDIVVEAAAIADLASGSTLAQVIVRLNELTEIVRNMGGLRRS